MKSLVGKGTADTSGHDSRNKNKTILEKMEN